MSLVDLKARVDRLELVIAILLGEIRRLGGETAPLAYVQDLLAPQGRGAMVDSIQMDTRKEGKPDGKAEL